MTDAEMIDLLAGHLSLSEDEVEEAKGFCLTSTSDRAVAEWFENRHPRGALVVMRLSGVDDE